MPERIECVGDLGPSVALSAQNLDGDPRVDLGRIIPVFHEGKRRRGLHFACESFRIVAHG